MKRYILLLIGLLFASSAFGQMYRLTSSPTKLTVVRDGGTHSVNVSCMDTVMDLRYASFNATHRAQIESVVSNYGGVTVKFKPNSGATVLNGTLTLYFNTAVGQLSTTVSYTQNAASYNIRANPTSHQFKRGGGAATVSIVYTELSGSPSSITISGAPAWCTAVHQGGGNIRLTAQPNQSAVARSQPITVTTSQNTRATFTISQEAGATLFNGITVAPGGGSHGYTPQFQIDTMVSSYTYQRYVDNGGQVNSANGGVINFKANTGTKKITGTVDLYFVNPMNTATSLIYKINYEQEPLNYTFTPNRTAINFGTGAETQTVTLSYSQRTGQTFALALASQPPMPAWCRMENAGNGTFRFISTQNLDYGTRSHNVILVFTNPLGGTLSQTISLSQQAVPFNITATSGNLNFDPKGGTLTQVIRCQNRPSQALTATFIDATNVTWAPRGATSNGSVAFTAGRNEGTTTRSQDVVVRYKNPLNTNLEISTTFKVIQAPIDYNFQINPASVTGSGNGGSVNISAKYINRTTTFDLPFHSSNKPTWVTAIRSTSGGFVADLAPNTTDASRTATFTITCSSRITGQTASATVTIVQPQAEYTFTPDQTSLVLAPQGETNKVVTMKYTVRSGNVGLSNPTIAQSAQWFTVTSLGSGQFRVTCPESASTSRQTGNFTVSYTNPLNTAQKISATVQVSQEVMTYTLLGPSGKVALAAAGGTAEATITRSGGTALNMAFVSCTAKPVWCTAVEDMGSGKLRIRAGENTTHATREGNVTVNFRHPTNGSTVPATFTISQAALNYGIKSSVASLNASHAGDTYTFDISYASLDKPFTLTYDGPGSLPAGVSVTAVSNTQLKAVFAPNNTQNDRSGDLVIYYKDPAVASYRTSATIRTTQGGKGRIYFDPYDYTIPAEGGRHDFTCEYRTDSSEVPNYINCVNLPKGATASGSGKTAIVVFAGNQTGATITQVVTVNYEDRKYPGQTLTAQFRVTQPSFIPPSTSSKRSVTRHVYTDEAKTLSRARSSKTYFDGFGRPIQQIQIKGSPERKDIVSFVKYDNMGRPDAQTFLPYVASTESGTYAANAQNDQEKFYNDMFGAGQGQYASSQTNYMATAMDMATARNRPGEAHNMASGYYSNFTIRLNTATDQIRRYVVNDNNLTFNGYYAANQLEVSETVNKKAGSQNAAEAAQIQHILEYRNATGQLIAKETRISPSDRRMTYYVYNDMGQLRYTITPAHDASIASGATITPAQATQLFSYYTEYNKNGLIYKEWAPGTQTKIYLYDKRGRLAFTQDGNLRASNKWVYTKYDEFNRPILTGTVEGTEAALTNALDNQIVFYETRLSTGYGYTNVAYPSVPDQTNLLSVTYYDDYDWPGAATYPFATAHTWSQGRETKLLGMITGSKTRVLGTSIWLVKASYYDKKYRTIQVVSGLYPSGTETTSFKYNFVGNVTEVKVKQVVGSLTSEYAKWYAYDDMGRLKTVHQQVTGDNANGLGGKVTVAEYTYNELGLVKSKKIHDNNAEINNFSYDMLGRMLSSTSNAFSYTLAYDKPAVTGATPRIDGNISAMTWKNSVSGTQKAYGYEYDGLGQLKDAVYREYSGSEWASSAKYNEKSITYDKNGNITALQRTNASGAALHNLSYAYSGNQLTSLTVNGAAKAGYTYDANGNQTTDAYRGTTTTYNILNLPDKISGGGQNITYIYSAAGDKLAVDANGSLTYYRGTMVYDQNNNLSYIKHPEGTIAKTGTAYVYNYRKTDQVGSTRVVLAAASGSNTLTAQQTTEYYPFGLSYTNNNLNVNKFLFSGKELQDGSVNGSPLGLYDFHARLYDPVTGRWPCQDRLRQYASPYKYAGNNPMRLIDPTGNYAFAKDSIWDVASGSWMYINDIEDVIYSVRPYINNTYDFNDYSSFFYGVNHDYVGTGVFPGDHMDFSGGGGNGYQYNAMRNDYFSKTMTYSTGMNLTFHRTLMQNPDLLKNSKTLQGSMKRVGWAGSATSIGLLATEIRNEGFNDKQAVEATVTGIGLYPPAYWVPIAYQLFLDVVVPAAEKWHQDFYLKRLEWEQKTSGYIRSIGSGFSN